MYLEDVRAGTEETWTAILIRKAIILIKVGLI